MSGIVSVRLTAAERAVLGDNPSQSLREMIRARMANNATSPMQVPVYRSFTTPRSAVIWRDGTFGGQWPASVTA